MNEGESVDPPISIPRLPLQEKEALGTDGDAQKLSKREERYLGSDFSEDELSKLSRRKDWGRQEAFRFVFEILAIATLIILFLTMLVVGTIWLWHMVAPIRYRWLSGDQVTILQDILTGGLVAGLIGPHFKRRLERI